MRGAPGGAEGDAARLLPIVDLANYAPTGAGANAELRNAPAAAAASEGGSDDPLAVSLYAVEAIPQVRVRVRGRGRVRVIGLLTLTLTLT